MTLRNWRRWQWGLLGAAVGLVFAACLVGPYLLEPTDSPEYVHVEVVAYQVENGGRQYFTVVSSSLGQSWRVGAARGAFKSDYRGPAILVIRRGRWTGEGHLRLVEGPPTTKTPN